MTHETRALMLFDGVCVFCSGAVRFILARDRAEQIGFSAMQSPAGQAMLRRLDVPLTEFETFTVLENDRLCIRANGLSNEGLPLKSSHRMAAEGTQFHRRWKGSIHYP